MPTVHYESVEQLIAAGDAPLTRTQRYERSSRAESVDGGWHGTASWERSIELARTGWAEGSRRVLELRTRLEGYVERAVVAKSQATAYDTTGDYVDIGRHLTGEPECFGFWQENENAVTQAKVIRIAYNTAVSCGVSQDSVFARGAAVIAAIDLLEALGNRVELWAVSGNEAVRGPNRGQTVQTHTLLKAANQPLDIDRVAFSLCHLGWQRRIQFASNEANDFPSQETRPAPVDVEPGVVLTEHGRRKGDYTQHDLESAVAALCQQAGIEIET